MKSHAYLKCIGNCCPLRERDGFLPRCGPRVVSHAPVDSPIHMYIQAVLSGLSVFKEKKSIYLRGKNGGGEKVKMEREGIRGRFDQTYGVDV